MRLFTLQKHQPSQQQIQQEIKEIHRYYRERIGIPRKLRQYEAKSALLNVHGFTPEKAAATIAQWNAGSRARKQQRFLKQHKLERSITTTSAQKANPASQSTKQVRDPSNALGGRQIEDLLKLSLEEKLLAMDLISGYQLEIARMEKMTSRHQRTIPSILVEKGWIEARTIGFLQAVLPQIRSLRWRSHSIADYLQQAGLLTHGQVIEINQEIQTSGLSFSDAAVAKGWVKQKSVEFITTCLNA